jgi:aldehyde dehydrogenase (NAD+)
MDSAVRERFINETSSGALVINDCIVHLNNPNLPFGGVGGSGKGSYHAKFGFDSFSYVVQHVQ